jgi:protein tyrosine/serine phosphatase
MKMNPTRLNRVFAVLPNGTLRPLIFLFGALLVIGNTSFLPAAWAANAAKAERPVAASPSKASPAPALVPGIDNFGQVDAHLYRGAQPQLTAFAQLQKLGIGTVVRFNPEGENMAAEKNQVESLGMKFVSLPWSGLGYPTHEEVVTFLDLLRDHPDGKIFVHCRLGADRTGVMVALYRLTFSHWNMALALGEMRAFHYHHTLLPHLQRYVEAFPAAMASDKDLLQFSQPIASLSH